MSFPLFCNQKIISLPLTAHSVRWSIFSIQDPRDPNLTYTFPRGKHNPEKKRIEKGSNSKIYSGKSSSGDEIAIRKLIISKEIKASQEKRLDRVLKHAQKAQNEMELIHSIQKKYPDNAPYIMDIYATLLDEPKGHENLFVVMPKGDCDLLTYIQNLVDKKESLSKPEIYRLFTHILSGLIALNQEDAFQCDLKPENLVFHNRLLKHIDLGTVARVGDTGGLVFSREYCSPEIATYMTQGKNPAFFSLETLSKTQSFLAGNMLYFLIKFHRFSHAINKHWYPNKPDIDTPESKQRFMRDLCSNNYSDFYNTYFSTVNNPDDPMFLVKHLTDPDITKRWSLEQALEFINPTQDQHTDTSDMEPENPVSNFLGFDPSLALGTTIALVLIYAAFSKKS